MASFIVARSGKPTGRPLGGTIDSDVAPDLWIKRLAALPLIDQPGRSFHYGTRPISSAC